jgi:hypothetical protein
MEVEKSMRSRLRPAPSTVLAALALFIALGGTSYAVSNRINGANLKNRSVAGTKLKKHTVTGTDVNVSTLPKVPAAHHADDSTNATNATNAITATNATDALFATTATQAGTITGTINAGQVSGTVANATNAANVDGHAFAQINATAGANNPATLLSDFSGLTLSCTGPSTPSGTVTLTVIDSSAQGGFFGASAIDETGVVHDDEGAVTGAIGGIPQATDFPFAITGGGAQISFSYKTLSGNTTNVVSGTLTLIQNNGCTASATPTHHP